MEMQMMVLSMITCLIMYQLIIAWLTCYQRAYYMLTHWESILPWK